MFLVLEITLYFFVFDAPAPVAVSPEPLVQLVVAFVVAQCHLIVPVSATPRNRSREHPKSTRFCQPCRGRWLVFTAKKTRFSWAGGCVAVVRSYV